MPARKLRFARDSPVEGTGFEISVPRETGVRGRLTRSATVAIRSVAALFTQGIRRGASRSRAARGVPHMSSLNACCSLANRSRCPTPAITQRLRQTRWWRSTSLPTLGPAPKRRCQLYPALSLPAACGRRAAHPERTFSLSLLLEPGTGSQIRENVRKVRGAPLPSASGISGGPR
jgi:hypothetical protein